MSRSITRFGMVRIVLLVIGLTGFVDRTLVYYPLGYLAPNAGRFAWLSLSIAVTIVFIGLALAALVLAFRKSADMRSVIKQVDDKKGRGTPVHLGSTILFALAVVALLLILSFAADWGPGVMFRPYFYGWSHLPRSNLFIAGGRGGWAYAFYVFAVIFALTIGFVTKLVARARKSVNQSRGISASRSTLSSRRTDTAPSTRSYGPSGHSDTGEQEFLVGTGPTSPAGH